MSHSPDDRTRPSTPLPPTASATQPLPSSERHAQQQQHHTESRSQSAASSDHDTAQSQWSSERRVPDKEQQISSTRDPPPAPYISYTHPPPPQYHSIHHAMSHRTESMVVPQRRYDYPKHDMTHPSPPPITTLTNSPSLSTSSLDRSAVSSPAPNGHHHAQPYSTPSYYSHSQSIKQSPKSYYASPHTPSMDNSAPPPQNYTYSSRSGYDHPSYRQDSMHQVPPSYGAPLPGVSHIAPSTMRTGYVPAHSMPSQSDYGIILTDDAATKLSDRVRRRCFNCCTTDTSTWRRSTLNPGKVLCNKCGLFERTHSRPRPDQFPHKRGHITTSSSARPRTPPPPTNQLPPMATQSQPPPPHTYSHPSIAPLFARADSQHQHHQQQQQQQQQWRGSNSSSSSQAPPPPPSSYSQGSGAGKKGLDAPARLRPVSPTPPSSRSESPSHKNSFSEQAHDRPT